MTQEQFDGIDDGLADSSTSAERTEMFIALLEELDERPSELGRRLRGLGDYRSIQAIQRMSTGDTAVSGEMLVIIRMLVNQQRLRCSRHRDVAWKQPLNGAWSANNIEGLHRRSALAVKAEMAHQPGVYRNGLQP